MTYTVQKGDTLSKIALKHGTTVSALAALNNIRNVNVIRTGQVLRLPLAEFSTEKYTELGKAVEKVVEDVENLESFKRLCDLL